MPWLPLFGSSSGGSASLAPGDRTLALWVSDDELAELVAFCADPEPGDRLLALVAGSDADGKPVLAFSQQRLRRRH